MASIPPKKDDDAEGKMAAGCLYVKVSMDGAPYLRKVDLNTYGSYVDLSLALEKMFSCFTIGKFFLFLSNFHNSCQSLYPFTASGILLRLGIVSKKLRIRTQERVFIIIIVFFIKNI